MTETSSAQQQSQPGSNGQADSADLQAQLAEKEKQLKEAENKYLYLYAEFDNFKKRAIKERSDLVKFGWESVARDLLQIVDNLDRAIEHVPSGTDKNFVDGLHMIASEFRSTLKRQGVETVPTVAQAFDPNLHEAVAQEESEHPAGTVVKEHTKGYTLHGRLLRPARVVVSGGKKDAG